MWSRRMFGADVVVVAGLAVVPPIDADGGELVDRRARAAGRRRRRGRRRAGSFGRLTTGDLDHPGHEARDLRPARRSASGCTVRRRGALGDAVEGDAVDVRLVDVGLADVGEAVLGHVVARHGSGSHGHDTSRPNCWQLAVVLAGRRRGRSGSTSPAPSSSVEVAQRARQAEAAEPEGPRIQRVGVGRRCSGSRSAPRRRSSSQAPRSTTAFESQTGRRRRAVRPRSTTTVS